MVKIRPFQLPISHSPSNHKHSVLEGNQIVLISETKIMPLVVPQRLREPKTAFFHFG